MRGGRRILGVLLVLAGCRATDDLRGYGPPCAEGWRECGRECIPESAECGPIMLGDSTSASNSTCEITRMELTVPDAGPSAILVTACIRVPYGQVEPLPTVTYRATPLEQLGFGDSLLASEAGGTYYYRSVVYWGTGFAAGSGEVATSDVNGECWFAALAYSGVASDRPVFHGASTEGASAEIAIESAPQELGVAQLCMKTFGTTMGSLAQPQEQTGRTFLQGGSNLATVATADEPGTAPTVILGWNDTSGVTTTQRRTSMGGVSLRPYCPTCIGTASQRHTTLASDDFNRPDTSVLGPPWLGDYPDRPNLAIVGARLQSADTSVTADDAIEIYQDAVPAPDDHWSSVVLASFGGTGTIASGPLVRWKDPPEVVGYVCRAQRNSAVETSAIKELHPGSSRLLAGNAAIDWKPGDTIRCEAEGPLLRLIQIRNGIETPVISASDPLYPSGSPGILLYSTKPEDGELDDFATGTFLSE